MKISKLVKMAECSKQIENNVGKGEIAHYEQFLLFPHCFQKTCTADILKPGLVWERVNLWENMYTWSFVTLVSDFPSLNNETLR